MCCFSESESGDGILVAREVANVLACTDIPYMDLQVLRYISQILGKHRENNSKTSSLSNVFSFHHPTFLSPPPAAKYLPSELTAAANNAPALPRLALGVTQSAVVPVIAPGFNAAGSNDNFCRLPVATSCLNTDPSFETENNVVSSAVNAVAVTESLWPRSRRAGLDAGLYSEARGKGASWTL